MLLRLARERGVLVVGGKGGVGKTSIASAVALAESRRGRRVLLVSTDPAHNLGHLWQREVGDPGTEVAAGLTAVEVDPTGAARAHLTEVRATMHRLVPEHLRTRVDEHLDLARDAPGMHEAATLERLTDLVLTALDADPRGLVVLDTAPSGHTARLLALPHTLGTWTDALLRGRDRHDRLDDAVRSLDRAARDDARRDVLRQDEIRAVLERRRARFATLRDVLTNHTRTAFALVLTAEGLPVLESVALHARLTELGVAVPLAVVNRRSPSGSSPLAERRAREDVHLRTLTDALPQLGTVEVPLLERDIVGADGLAELARALAG